jgi:hypothetical protein
LCKTLDSRNKIELSSITIDETFAPLLASFHFDDNAGETAIASEVGLSAEIGRRMALSCGSTARNKAVRDSKFESVNSAVIA